MASGAVLAAALTDHSARTRALWIGGLDVLKEPGGRRYGVPLESIELSEAGAYGVSTLTFRVDDPQLLLLIQPGMDVRFHDLTWDVPLFVGWVDPFTALPDFATGRTWTVQCVGVEALLDWSVITSDRLVTVLGPGGIGSTNLAYNVQTMVGLSNCPITLNIANGVYPAPSSRDTPISAQAQLMGTIADFTVTAGTTLREAIRACITHAYLNDPQVPVWMFTVDWWFGLRLYHTNEITGWSDDPDDARPLSVVDTPVAGPFQASDLSYTTEGITPHSVYVQGGNAAGSGLVSDGSGLIGPTATMQDTTILTSSARDVAGQNYLAARRSGMRGQFMLSNALFSNLSSNLTQTRPDSILAITDTQAGLDGATTLRLISGITKRFHGTVEDWTISFGGPPPSVATLMRSLTRDTRS